MALAERYVERARSTSGEESLEYATAITWLGWLYKKQQRYTEAEPLLKQALEIREEAFGPIHPPVATSLNNLVGLYQAQGRGAEAAPLMARVEAIHAKAVGIGMLEALPREIQTLQSKGEDGEAARLAEHYVAPRSVMASISPAWCLRCSRPRPCTSSKPSWSRPRSF